MPALLAMALAVIGVVLAHALGRSTFARRAKLPIERARLRVFVRLGRRDRTSAHLGALAVGNAAAYLAVAALAFAFWTCQGVPAGEPTMVVDDVLDGHDAVGKLQPGDQLVAAGGVPLVPNRRPSLTDLVAAKHGAPVTLTVRRAGALLDVTVQPKRSADRASLWLIGIRQRQERERTTAVTTVAGVALLQPAVDAGSLLTEYLAPLLGSDDSDPGGPVRIVAEFRRPASLTAWLSARSAAAHALLVLALVDLVRAVALLLARRRPAA